MSAMQNRQFLQQYPSLSLVYLPAERRLVQPRSMEIDLNKLSDDASFRALAEARNSGLSSGQLDDREFEQYAIALCIQGTLPSEAGDDDGASRSRWEQFKESVDDLLFPKALAPLTREHSNELRVSLPDGSFHPVSQLSSGERQALIIISRVFRAGEGQSLIAIDEPDAYLHPSLSSRLMLALRPGLQDSSRMIVATHSPAILDSLSPDSILKLSHDSAPVITQSEGDRLRLYRDAGFRASALTQSDLLVITEGAFDSTMLPQLVPELGVASITAVGGRDQVLKTVQSLAPYDLPVIGIVDGDVLADEPGVEIGESCIVWPAADLEGVILSDDTALQEMIDGRLSKSSYGDAHSLREVLDRLLLEFRESAISEAAQRVLRRSLRVAWPSPRGDDPIGRLRHLSGASTSLSAEAIEAAISDAAALWEASSSNLWKMVRGKWLVNRFAVEVSNFNNGESLLQAVAARQPALSGISPLRVLASSRIPAVKQLTAD
ncbi:AAA family ATPase [Jiangella alkaliphila]|uniref:AAA domain-containing protein, putative AbiEii toxin, Type IV TA system n=1 Tax=Jiangella alkaliphila TaxID=419479 RepID=A0A1H2IUF1_9ACTN|nr:AAA family ATPase [Jiangella alkaliphila]SDU47641.1 AAA domain-containing protein, putative AbiEii toxin, Type IV TA system [Jiangella alkaliphila]